MKILIILCFLFLQVSVGEYLLQYLKNKSYVILMYYKIMKLFAMLLHIDIYINIICYNY